MPCTAFSTLAQTAARAGPWALGAQYRGHAPARLRERLQQIDKLPAGDRPLELLGELVANDAANTVVARVTGLPIDGPDTLLHLGIAGRWAQAPNGELHYKARPEVNQAPHFVDSGQFAATDEKDLDLELAWQQGPVFTTAEYVADWVNSSANGNPFFDGFYVSTAWMLTGERRPYNRAAGTAVGP